MGVKKKYLEKRVAVNFKTSPKKREKFNEIVNNKLLTKSNFVMNRLIDDFIEEFEDPELKGKAYKKYFKLGL